MTFDAVGRKYAAAVAEVADCQPLLAPLGPSMLDMHEPRETQLQKLRLLAAS